MAHLTGKSTCKNVTIIEARWQEVLGTDKLKKYDQVFFDDFPNNIKLKTKIHQFQTNIRIHLFIDILTQYHLNRKGRLSAYICKNESLYNDSLWKSKYIDNPNWTYKEKIIKTKISNIQNYHQSNNKAIIPLLTFGI